MVGIVGLALVLAAAVYTQSTFAASSGGTSSFGNGVNGGYTPPGRKWNTGSEPQSKPWRN